MQTKALAIYSERSVANRNRLHNGRDVNFWEDATGITTGVSGRDLATIHNVY